jgi:alpha-L-fucosidase 2
MDFAAPAGETMTCRLRLSESPGKQAGEMNTVSIRHTEEEMYFHAAYARTMGRPLTEGYQLLARVIPHGGSAHVVSNEAVTLTETEHVLVIMRLVYLEDSTATEIDSLRATLAALPADYDTLLAGHVAVHGEMFARVTLDLDSTEADDVSSEQLLKNSNANGPSARLLEMVHAVGRYALICGGTGDLPVALSGIWGNTWTPPWDGRYTFDANINLAISGVSQGDLPEAIETYWRYNARQTYGCRGILTDLCQGWGRRLAGQLSLRSLSLYSGPDIPA